MAIYEIDGIRPTIPESAYVADSAEVIGDVRLGEKASVWFGAVIRGDCGEPIVLGDRTNIQDQSMLHADYGKPLVLGNDVTIGHQVMLHGCTIGDGSLVGIQAVVLNGAKIGKNSVVAAGAVVTEGKEFPDNALIMGAPAKVVRVMDDAEAKKLQFLADHYVENGARYRKGLRKVG